MRRRRRDRAPRRARLSGAPALTSGAAALLIALALDLAFGDPPNAIHPVAWLGRLIAQARVLLARGSASRLFTGGVVVAAGVAVIGWGVGAAVERLAARVPIAGVVVVALALKCSLSVRGLARAAGEVRERLGADDLAAGRASVGRHLVSRDTAALDVHEVASAAIESVAENLTDAVVAPLAFFLVLGLPGALAYRAVNTADAMLGYRDGDLEYFGKAAARLDDLLNWIPARLAALALALAAIAAGAPAGRVLATARRDHGRTASPNAGWTMAVMAGALGVVLAKRGAYALGEGRSPCAADIAPAVRLMLGAAIITTLGALALALSLSP